MKPQPQPQPQRELKKRKVDASPSLRTFTTPADDKGTASTLRDKVPVAQTSNVNLKIQHAKNFAVSQAQQECCTGNFRIFDSPFGNFLVPVIPTRAELSG